MSRLGVAFLVAALVSAVLALPSSAAASAPGVVVHKNPAAAASTAAWTPAQMRAAEPRELLRPPRAGASAARAGGVDGPPGSVAARPPRDPFSQARAEATPSAFGPFLRGPVEDPTAYPYSTWGKVFGRIPGVGRFSCSATVVHGRNRSVVFTAAHCVRDPRDGWVTQFAFVPAYEDGARPFGQWGWRKIFVRRQWARRGNPNFDYAAVKLGPNRRGRVEDVVGSLGFAYNYRKRRRYLAVGYPFNRLDGEAPWYCFSRFGSGDPFYLPPGPVPIGISCDMLGGASGGGWRIARDRLASVSSFGFQGRRNELYGPRFNKKAEQVRRAAARG